jgi:hypothetical protein
VGDGKGVGTEIWCEKKQFNEGLAAWRTKAAPLSGSEDGDLLFDLREIAVAGDERGFGFHGEAEGAEVAERTGKRRRIGGKERRELGSGAPD